MIRPWMFPVVCCAIAGAAATANAQIAIIATMILLMPECLPLRWTRSEQDRSDEQQKQGVNHRSWGELLLQRDEIAKEASDTRHVYRNLMARQSNGLG